MLHEHNHLNLIFSLKLHFIYYIKYKLYGPKLITKMSNNVLYLLNIDFSLILLYNEK
jgi:hypothetical protein